MLANIDSGILEMLKINLKKKHWTDVLFFQYNIIFFEGVSQIHILAYVYRHRYFVDVVNHMWKFKVIDQIIRPASAAGGDGGFIVKILFKWSYVWIFFIILILLHLLKIHGSVEYFDFYLTPYSFSTTFYYHLFV